MPSLAEFEARLAAVEQHKLELKDLPLETLKTYLANAEPNDPNFTLLPKSIGAPLLAEGAIGLDQLSTESKDSFIQLAASGDHKISFGISEVEFAGGTELSITKEVEHGLEVVPQSIVVLRAELTSVKGSSGIITWGSEPTSATKFKINANYPTGSIPEAGGKVKFFWIAIG